MERAYTTYIIDQKFDENNNICYEKDSDGVETYLEYDEAGHCIHMKNTNGDETINEYDADGNCIHEKYFDGAEAWYDSQGEMIDVIQ